MFGNPIAMEAELFSMNGEGRGVDEGFANGASFNDGTRSRTEKRIIARIWGDDPFYFNT